MSNVLPFIDLKEDKWVLPSSDDLSDFTFEFDHLPNEWFKETIKKITRENIIIGRLKLSTLHRYNYSLDLFWEFLREYNIELNTFEDLSYDLIEVFIHYLLANIESPSTRALAVASLKHHIKHGQIFEWEGFPTKEIFDGTEYRTLQTEDTLKSMLIDDQVMNSIDSSLKEWKQRLTPVIEKLNEIVLWALITIIRHTGIRLTEALNLKVDCMNRDLMGKYLLEVISTKNETDRYIPVSKEVAVAIDYLSQATEKIRFKLNTEKLFYYQQVDGNYRILRQVTARAWLENRFIKRFNIRDSNGELARLTFHNFRHQIGTDLLNNGMSAFEVMQYLGHESMHSTRLYAKVRNDRLTKEYNKLGFIGVIKKSTKDIVDENGKKLNSEKRLMAQLPDGVCAKPIGTKVIDCKKPNACLFCQKFITTPEFLDVHKEHLERIKADKERYLAEELMGSEYHLFETEKVLEEIISRLTALQGGAASGNN